ncbi:hypothetical protein TIFTF001_004227 [Ficus carica]|uniref:Cytochrome P450 n=1 Tax=Ficus carica TaxID=3494 RepID=A0AA87ZFD8_FICCA|nr:hypothetical protein TIFTF001_004227 [Ficus carica]
MQRGLIVVKLVLAQLVHCFDWELPNGLLPAELDMTEEFGVTTPRANHLIAIPTYRLREYILEIKASLFEWAKSQLLKNPKVPKELETVVGMNRIVEESDLERPDYSEMVVKESMRLHPPRPLTIPREAMEDCTVNGFHIPQKSPVVINKFGLIQIARRRHQPELHWQNDHVCQEMPETTHYCTTLRPTYFYYCGSVKIVFIYCKKQLCTHF